MDRRPLGVSAPGLALALLVLAAAAPALAQVDPLLFLKTERRRTWCFVVDTASAHAARRARPTRATSVTSRATSDYYDPYIYSRTRQSVWEPARRHRRDDRRSIAAGTTNLDHIELRAATSSRHDDSDRRRSTTPLTRVRCATRLAIARAALYQAVTENKTVARFGLVKTRQTNAGHRGRQHWPGRRSPTSRQLITETGSVVGRWNVYRPTVVEQERRVRQRRACSFRPTRRRRTLTC